MHVLEAAELLVEILKKCKSLKGSSIMLMSPKPLVTMAEGYKLHIDVSDTNRGIFACIENIAKSHGLSCFEDSKGIMIYRMR
jgi:hypothetical protein